jgi:UDP-N-acetylglucosamine 2-epimerase (non-hydrolysing)
LPAPAIVYIVGARPNIVKMAPVLREMRLRAPEMRHVLVHTGQHYDRQLSNVFFEEFGLGEPEFELGVGSGTHGEQTARALERVEGLLAEVRPVCVVVPGDVNSTLAAGLAAAKLGVPVAHLEAGLRSFDRTMPEEINRVLVDQISRWCFIHSPEAAENLRREGIEAERIRFVGNTMIDTLVALQGRIGESEVLSQLGLDAGRYLLVTLHRPALVDGPLLEPAMAALTSVARSGLPVVFPVHPRTRARLSGLDVAGVSLIEPVGYLDFLALQASAAGVLTDSGGVQEETTFLRIPCFTLRENTERPITVSQGTNRLLGLRPEAIAEIPRWLEATGPSRVEGTGPSRVEGTGPSRVEGKGPSRAEGKGPSRVGEPEGWDGRAAVRVADELLGDLTGAFERPSLHLVR